MKTGEIAEFLAAELIGDPDVEIVRVAALESAGPGELAFLERGEPPSTNASCILVSKHSSEIQIGGPVLIAVREPKLAFARVAELLHPSKSRGAEIHPSAVISPYAKTGTGAFI